MQILLIRDSHQKYKILKDVSDIEFFNKDNMSARSFLVCVENSSVIGMIAFVESTFYQENSFGIAYVSVSQQHKNRGVSKLLVDKFFKLAVIEGKGIVNTSYEPEGKAYLEKVVSDATVTYPEVKFVQR